MTEFVMSCAGLGGSILATAFILLILKPVYKSMQEDVFLKIGGNGNMWGILSNSFINILLDVYKYFTLCKSFLKLDLIICIFFSITSFFFWYVTDKDYYLLPVEIVMVLLILVNSYHGHYIVRI